MKYLYVSLSLLLLLCIPFSSLRAEGYRWQRDVSYISEKDTSVYRQQRCKLDLYLPTDSKTPFKTLVWFHGGALEGGSKQVPHGLQEQGFAVAAVNYRLFPQGRFPDYLTDAAEAVAWVQSHIASLGGDSSQIYVAGHSAGGYLTLMLCLDKHYLAQFGLDADSVRGYFPVSGQCATHYTIRKERKSSTRLPLVDAAAPRNQVRKLSTKLVLITGDRKLEQMARYEENLYLKAVLEGFENPEIPLYELEGFDHGKVVEPACLLINRLIKAAR